MPVLAERGHIEALRVLMRPGKTGFALQLARALATRGRLDEAIAIMTERIDADEQNAYEWTIELLVELGEADRALRLRRKRGHKLRSPVDTSDFQLARLLDEQGRHEEAIDVLSHKGGAPTQLADLLAGVGCMDEAMMVLDGAQHTVRVKSVGDKLAEHQAALLARYGHLRELRDRAANGHPEHREIMRSHLTRAQAAATDRR
ncbi:tetratricopeptide repeat protein [Streptomyces sp. NPDC002870]|uniref:tetratricopeptide repeat protein n=1 Tax=Streptomyces sp. NPDC002870 TaxID=3364666 RepID=UPI0036A87931